MVDYNPKSWLKLIFHLAKSDTLSILWKELIFIFLFTLGLAWIELTYFPEASKLEKLFAVYQILGFVLSLLLAFRTNTAYERWWEGRKAWGGLVNDSRNLAVKIAAMDLSKEDKEFFGRHISNFAWTMKEHLRNGPDLDLLNLKAEELSFLKKLDHIPAGIVELMFAKLELLQKEGQITGDAFLRLDKNLSAFLDHVGVCERIKNTPIPYSYSLFFKKFIILYVLTLPLAFVMNFGYWTAAIAVFIFYVMVSIEILAEEIEDPFGKDDNDLPTDKMASSIQTIIKSILYDKDTQ